MRSLLSVLPCILLIAAMATGCATTTITNLTPESLPPSESGFYRIEAAWESRKRTLLEDTVEPVVLTGEESYPMKPVPLTRGRWETLVPVPERTGGLVYRFKFNFMETGFGQQRRNSRLSPFYRLEIDPPSTP